MTEKNCKTALGFSSRLHRTRRSRGWSQKELARRAGVTQPMVAKWERGLANVKLSTVVRLSKILCIAPEWLAFGSKKTPKQG